jgi:hypothetical protein
VIAALVDDEGHRALRRAERAHGADDTEALHDLRKAGRRLRYAAEAVSTEPGRALRRADPLRWPRWATTCTTCSATTATRCCSRSTCDARERTSPIEGAAALVFEQLAVAADDARRRAPA